MDNQIICPSCGKAIPLTEALSQKVDEKYRNFYKLRLEQEKQKIESGLKEVLTRQIKEKIELDMRDKTNEAEELKKQNAGLKEQILELNRLFRQMKSETEQSKLDLEKSLGEAQEKIRAEEKKRAEDEYKFRIMEKDKKLDDAQKLVDEYKRKMEQGSQQLQGEVMELEIENTLRREFQDDEIREVPKGIKGADVCQVVRNKMGRICGTIIWESKRTKSWSDGWIGKLKEDQRDLKAEIAVIISSVLPDEVRNFSLINGVWVTDFDSFIGLATALRIGLMELASVKSANIGKNSKMEILYSYFSGIEFKQRLEAIMESFDSLQADIETEKRWYAKKWARQERDIRKVFDNISGMYGDLQAMIGKSLPEVKGLEMLPGEVQEKIL